jgi:fatty acid-binding protein DegV
VLQLTVEAVGGMEIEQMGIVHVAARQEAEAFAALLRETVACPDDILFADLTAGLSVHSGAGMVGVGFILAE